MLTVKRTQPYDVNEVFEYCTYENDGYTMPYRLYVPKNYDCGEMYPLVILLHGAGERGTDNKRQLIHGFQDMFNDVTSPIYDSIIIAPQCPPNSQWVLTPWWDGNYSIAATPESREIEAVLAIMDQCRSFYNVDDDRIYVTGLSMGGYGTWDILARHGARFAAGMPVCGGGDRSYAPLLKRIPIWTAHGSVDDAVPVSASREMFAAIKKAGGENISYTEFDGRGHSVWTDVYSDRAYIDWLFSNSLAERRKKAERKTKITKAAAAIGGLGVLVSAALIIIGKNKKKK